MENKEYFIHDGREKSGPYTLEALSTLSINGDTKIWCAGMDNWVKASALPELSGLVNSLPPDIPSRKKPVMIGGLALLILVLVFAASKIFFTGKPIVMAQSILSNQQLYSQYAPGIVLIQQRYIYQITAGEKKFYFNEFYTYGEGSGYITGLTDDSLIAVKHAEPIQGTGFFISKDGKLLTNRHVAKANPNNAEQEMIRNNFFESLDGTLSNINYTDSINKSKAFNDSLLIVLLQDSITNAAKITDVREKIANAETFLEGGEEDWEAPKIKLDAGAITDLKGQPISIKKITIELRIFRQGTPAIETYNGIKCKVIAISEDENVDLALLQTSNKELPDTSIRMIDLSRINNVDNNNSLQAKMSERLILIGYNRGTDLATTTAGIQAQLTDGKVSQNTDDYKLMYTIPTLPGSSGSPVLDDKGRLVSVNFAGWTETQSFNYGIQPKQIRNFLKANDIKL